MFSVKDLTYRNCCYFATRCFSVRGKSLTLALTQKRERYTDIYLEQPITLKVQSFLGKLVKFGLNTNQKKVFVETFPNSEKREVHRVRRKSLTLAFDSEKKREVNLDLYPVQPITFE